MTTTPRAAHGRRLALSAALTLAATAALILTASAASADIGDRSTPAPLTTMQSVLLFFVFPVVAFVVIGALFARSSTTSAAAKYRPGRSWDHAAVWFGDAPAAGDGPVTDMSAAGGSHGSW